MIKSLSIEHSILYQKMLLVFISTFYILFFESSFNAFVVERFSYFGFVVNKLDLLGYLLVKIVVVFVALCLPIKVERASQFFILFIVTFIYYPSSVVLFSIKDIWLSIGDAYYLFWCLTFSLLIIICFSNFPVFSFRQFYVSRKIFNFFNLIVLMCIFFLAFKVSSNFTLVNSDELEQLNDVRNKLPISGFGVYFYLWTITFFIGLLFFVYGKVNFFVRLFILFFLYFIFAFSMGAKILLIAPLIFSFILFWVKFCGCKFVSFISSFIIVFIVFYFVGLFSSDLAFLGNALFTFRTLSISSLSFALYFDYFKTVDFTYFQHLAFVHNATNILFNLDRTFIPLPVNLASNYNLGNINANFIVNDGYSSLGLPGMILVSFFYSVLMYVFDSLTHNINKYYLFFSLTYFGMYLGNVSLFTLLLSHGLLIAMLYFYFFSRYLREKV